jgi:hypothetical protein
MVSSDPIKKRSAVRIVSFVELGTLVILLVVVEWAWYRNTPSPFHIFCGQLCEQVAGAAKYEGNSANIYQNAYFLGICTCVARAPGIVVWGGPSFNLAYS